ncbi:MAG: SDR family oxidoreductase [Chloroflexota bacterium]
MTMNEKVVAITGASDGLGEAIAYQLADKGYSVWLLARNETKLQQVVAAIKSQGGKAAYAVCDVTSAESVADSFEKIEVASGRIDIVINNAGVWHSGATVSATADDIIRTVSTNLTGLIFVTQAAIKRMQTQGSGHIVNVISVAGVEPNGDWSIYTASKYGARGFTDSLKLELAGSGIKVSGIYPAGISTGLFVKAGVDLPPGQPWMMPKEDVAAAVVQVIEQSDAITLDHVEIRQAN